MKKRYLAYLFVLAGWLLFCYWLYSTDLYPRLHPKNPAQDLVFDPNQSSPLAFNWGSDIPIAGKGFEEWSASLKSIDAGDNILIMRAYYFSDEARSPKEGQDLARKRLKHLTDYLEINRDGILTEVQSKEIYADVKSYPFEALDYEEIPIGALVRSSGDTAEICFPLKDSLTLPAILTASLNPWLMAHDDAKMATTYLLGIADGTGIAESSDMATERAIVIKNYLLGKGWNEERLNLSTGQRSESLPLRNRCVMIYYE
ncbi:MAG: hypothetical protein ABIQ11_11375 [Saprospiraceae bacterium]